MHIDIRITYFIFFFIVILPREPWYAHPHYHPVKAKTGVVQTKVLWWVLWGRGACLKYLEEQKELW